MSKLVEIDGKSFRRRRGRLVQIPPHWVGRTSCPQTIRNRPSKRPRKERMLSDREGVTRRGHPRNWPPRHVDGRFREKVKEVVDREVNPSMIDLLEEDHDDSMYDLYLDDGWEDWDDHNEPPVDEWDYEDPQEDYDYILEL